MKPSAGFLGTYFDREVVFRNERWVRLIAWSALAIYLIQALYDAFQNVYGALISNYPLDWYFLINLAAKIVQGGVLFILLQVAAQILLILVEIEENTRRAAYTSSDKE
jgi:hypothetical protein